MQFSGGITFSGGVTFVPPPTNAFSLYSWGINNHGQLGLNSRSNVSSPNKVGSGTNWNNISIAYWNTIATKTDGTLWTWGRNIEGQLGLSATADKSSPTQVGTGITWDKVSIGTYNTIATRTL